MTGDSVGELFRSRGYELYQQFYSDQATTDIKSVVDVYHEAWLEKNRKFYEDRAVNSAYLTNPGTLSDAQRLQLFRLIGHLAEQQIVKKLLNQNVCFMNTQLFFNPYKTDQKNYWHRDVQYTGLNEAQQKAVVTDNEILHFRIALADEPGMEFVPGTHARWDTPLETSVRLAQDGCEVFDDLPDAVTVPMKKGDMLVFSANMIHRGLYGMNRSALDILFFNPEEGLQDSVQLDSLPDHSMMQHIEYSRVFSNSLNFLNVHKQ